MQEPDDAGPFRDGGRHGEFELALGRGLSAFALRLPVAGGAAAVENAFQGGKVFERAGPRRRLRSGAAP